MLRLSCASIIFTSCFLILTSPQIHACAAPTGDTLLFDVVPEVLLDADVIAEVSFADINDNGYPAVATVNIVRLIKTSDQRVRPDEKITVKYDFSTCGPFHRSGDEGIIIAKAGPDIDGRPVLCLYSHDGLRLCPSACQI